MDRRRFIVAIGSSSLLTGVASFGFASYFSGGQPLNSNRLVRQLAELADPQFLAVDTPQTPEHLAGSLMEKGVLSAEAGINHRRLSDLASNEPLVEHEGFLYTATELELYVLAARVHRQ